MSDKCTHETSVIEAKHTGFSVLRCTWECGQDLIELDLGNHNVKTLTAAELSALRQKAAERDALVEAINETLPQLQEMAAHYTERGYSNLADVKIVINVGNVKKLAALVQP